MRYAESLTEVFNLFDMKLVPTSETNFLGNPYSEK